MEDTKTFSAENCKQKNLVFRDTSFMAILAGVTLSESVKLRHSSLSSENLTNIISYNLETVQDRSKLVLITNRKSNMSFRLVPKWVTLNDLERRNGRYIALFQRTW